MERKQSISRAIHQYNIMLHDKENNDLRIFVENLEDLSNGIFDEQDLNEEIETWKAIRKKKKKEGKKKEVKLISLWLRSVEYPEVDEEILPYVN